MKPELMGALQSPVLPRCIFVMPTKNCDLCSARAKPPLCAWRGTLTPEEFRQIHQHAQMSYELLRQIPWTANLSNVPTIARSHHERLDGSGYPQGLRLNEIPLGAKLMGICDIYDALTASDRPYKRAMSTELAPRILLQEAMQGKLDSEALEMFIEREVYRVND